MAMILSAGKATIPRHDPVTIRRIGVSDLRDALRQGWNDFTAIPTQLVFLGIVYPVVGLVAARAAAGYDLVVPLLFPLVAGVSLLGPVLAVGIYELSRRRENGLPVSWLNAFDVLRSPALPGIALVGVMLLAIFGAWLLTAKLIFDHTVGLSHPASASGFVQEALHSAAGWQMMVWGNLAGFAFAVAVLALTVVSVPMMLDRTDTSAALAIRTSVRAVLANPGPMSLWGFIVAAILLLGCLPVFVGLALAMPVLGHATWHLYRKVIA